MANNPPQKKDGGKGSLGGLFQTHEKKGPDPEMIKLRHDFNSLSRRVRETEERSANLRKKVQMTDYNVTSTSKRTQQDLKVMTLELNELKHMMNDLDNKMLLLIKELRMCARNEDLKVLQKYINMWEPINFVTRNEVERIILDTVEEVTEKVIKAKLEIFIEKKIERMLKK